MTINTNKNPERVAECSRLISEIQDFQEELTIEEIKITSDIEESISKWGESTFITDSQYRKLQEIYERVC